MRTMSGEAEPRVCDEDFGSDEGDVESYLEEDNSSELMDRLRDLEAENSALMLANENQREAYERCLDEVANHVVQALLNQKDLREECIKLKMLVFDLERQNRALCELFQQKLPNQSSAQYQFLPGPLPECNSALHIDSAKQVETALTEAQAKHASPGPRGPAASMEALSPFFKKKAHILEVLRKMEETDPLKFHPSAATLSFCDYGQALMSTEAALAAGELPLACKPRPCRCSCPEVDAHHPHLNGEVAAVAEEGEGGDACKKSADGPPGKCGHVCGPPKHSWAQNHVISTAALNECHHGNSTTAESGPPLKQAAAKDHQQPGDPDSYLSIATSADQNGSANQSLDDYRAPPGSKVEAQEADGPTGDVSDESGGKAAPQMSYCEMASGNVPRRDPPPEKTPEKDGARPDPALPPAAVGPASVSSPSKLLKFLKIPSVAERRGQGGGGGGSAPVRLSPQLTRTSRIPCRTNNYEVYHSPVPSRRATTTERCRQPPPPPARSESYPATHSAPTSPPQPEELRPLPAKELGYTAPKASRSGGAKLVPAPSSSSSSSSVVRVSPRVPHYENVSDLSLAGQQPGAGQSSQTRSTLPNHSKAGGGDRKLVKSLPEEAGVAGPPREQSPSSSSSSTSSSSSSESSSEQEVDAESAAWRDLHSLPRSSALHRAPGGGGANHPRTARTPDAEAAREAGPAAPDLPQAPPPPPRRNDPSSIPRRAGPARPGAESGHHAFKDRLAALGKLRSSEELQVGLPLPGNAADAAAQGGDAAVPSGDERGGAGAGPADDLAEEQRHGRSTDSLDGKPKSDGAGGGVKGPGACQLYEPGAKPPGPSGAKAELEPLYSRVATVVATPKTDSPKIKLGLPSPIMDTPQVLRNNMKCPASLNLPYTGKPPGPGGGAPNPSGGAPNPSGPSPSKVPPKSPSRPCQPPSAPRRPPDATRYSSKSEERSKAGGSKKKNPAYGDSLPPPPPRPPADSPPEAAPAPALSPQSAIEQKVMKGIEENMLKLQEQDRGGGAAPEVKQKASNGIASWFGLKKSKLPALSRKADAPKAKEEKREWRINIPSVGKDSKMTARCKEGVEGLNISTLMEKAEGLRRALEEERAYVDRAGVRGHSCEVVMDQAQGQLAVMYRGGRSDNFMQQLLNRVDGKDIVPSVPQRRLSFDCKTSRQPGDAPGHHAPGRDDVEKGSDLTGGVTSDDSLAGNVHAQHFAGSGASTYTLDSGIGTFPLPDYGGVAGRSLSKARPGGDSQASPGRVGRRSRTLDRDMSSLEEGYPAAHKQLIPTVQLGAGPEERSPARMHSAGVIHEDKDAYGAHMFTPRSKTWTFPSLKPTTGPTEVYLTVDEEEEEPAPYGSPFRGSVKPRGPPSSRAAVDPASLPLPPQTGLGRRGKTRTPSAPDMHREAGLELLRERPEEALSPSRPQVLETPESLSDSLYDSLSSCGSQG